MVSRLVLVLVAAAATAVGAAPAAAADTTPPPTPLNFYVNTVTDTVVSMQWAPGYLTEPTGWRLYRNGALIVSSVASGHTDRNLTPGTTYSYFVVAYDRAGNTSPPTRTVTVTTRGAGVAPGGPANLRVKEVSPARITLEFDRPGDEFDVSRYPVYDGGTQVTAASTIPFAQPTTTVEIRHLTPGSRHAYTVRASRDGHDLSVPSNTLTVTLPRTADRQPPSVPTGLVATESRYACDFADLAWRPSTDDTDAATALDYEAYATDGTFINYVRGTDRLLNVQFFNHGTHTVTIRAVDSSGNASPHSTTATFVVDPYCPLEGG